MKVLFSAIFFLLLVARVALAQDNCNVLAENLSRESKNIQSATKYRFSPIHPSEYRGGLDARPAPGQAVMVSVLCPEEANASSSSTPLGRYKIIVIDSCIRAIKSSDDCWNYGIDLPEVMAAKIEGLKGLGAILVTPVKSGNNPSPDLAR